MKRLSTIFLLLFIVNTLLAQKKSRNGPQSFMAIETGLPIINRSYAHLPIPLNIEWQRKNRRWGLGASIALQYDRESSGDCSNRTLTINTGRYLGNFGPYFPYCETLQNLNLKPSIFGAYYFVQKKRFSVFAKLGGIANIPILAHQDGEYYKVETTQVMGTTITAIDAGPIHIKGNGFLNQTRIGLLSGLGVNYFLNKRTALRFTLQSESYCNYWPNGGSLVFALGGINFKI
jgi:hypothetical protein